jgi:hypothetical protein
LHSFSRISHGPRQQQQKPTESCDILMLSKSIIPCIHEENRVKSSHIIKLQDTDTGYRTYLESARVSLAIMERKLLRDDDEEDKRETHTDRGQEEVS